MSDTVVFCGGPLDGIVWETGHASPVENIRIAAGETATYSDTGLLDDEGRKLYEHEAPF